MTRKGWRTMTRTRRRMRSVTARGHYPCCRASRGRRRMRGSFTRRRQVLLIVLRRCQHHLQHHFFWKFILQIVVVYNYDIVGIFYSTYVQLSPCNFFFSFLKNCLSHFLFYLYVQIDLYCVAVIMLFEIMLFEIDLGNSYSTYLYLSLCHFFFF